MADTILLEIVTPTGVALRKSVAELTAPSVAGEFGVLPGHIPVLAALRTGTVSYRDGSDEKQVAVGMGFVEVIGEKAIVLTEKFARKEDVDIVETRSRLKEIGEELSGFAGELDDPKRVELIEEEQWLGALLVLAGDPPPPTMREDTRASKRKDDWTVTSSDDAGEQPEA